MCDVLRLPRHRHCLVVLVYCSYCMIPVYETSQSTATKADNESETEAECMAGAGAGAGVLVPRQAGPGWAAIQFFSSHPPVIGAFPGTRYYSLYNLNQVRVLTKTLPYSNLELAWYCQC